MADPEEKPHFVLDKDGNVIGIVGVDLSFDDAPGARPPQPPQKPPVAPPYQDRFERRPVRSGSGPGTMVFLPLIGVVIFVVVMIVQVVGAINHNYQVGIQNDFNEGKGHLIKGYASLEAGDEEGAMVSFTLALQQFNQAISSKPDYGEAYDHRGLVYQGQGRYDLAIADGSKAIQLMPGSHMAYNNRGTSYHARGDLEKAEADYTKAIELNSEMGKAYFNRGLIMLSRGDYERAIVDFSEAVDHSNTSPGGMGSMSDIIRSQEENSGDTLLTYARQSMNSFSKSLEWTSDKADRPTSYAYRGMAYLEAGKVEQALADFEQALQLREDFSMALLYRGQVYLMQGDFEKAARDLTRIMELNNDPDAAQAAGELLATLGLK